MSISKYEAFIKTLELGSLTKAAESLGYTQSAVSQMLGSLEAELGVTLLRRSRTGVELTEDGRKLRPYIERLRDCYYDLEDQATQISGSVSGYIRIGAFTSLTGQWLPDILKSFQKKYPKIEFELFTGDYSETDQWVCDGVVDMGFRRMKPLRDLEAIHIFDEKMYAVLPKGHPLAEEEVFPLEKAKEHPFIYPMTARNDAGGKPYPGLDTSQLNIQYRLYDFISILPMVEQDMGISILPELVLKRTPYDVVIKELDPPITTEMWIVLKSRKKAPVAVRRFISYIMETL